MDLALINLKKSWYVNKPNQPTISIFKLFYYCEWNKKSNKTVESFKKEVIFHLTPERINGNKTFYQYCGVWNEIRINPLGFGLQDKEEQRGSIWLWSFRIIKETFKSQGESCQVFSEWSVNADQMKAHSNRAALLAPISFSGFLYQALVVKWLWS